jgi:hypothetical protein
LEKFDIYIAVLVYPSDLTPEEYAELALRHFEWCKQNGIYQLLHACYKMGATKEEVQKFINSLIISIKSDK